MPTRFSVPRRCSSTYALTAPLTFSSFAPLIEPERSIETIVSVDGMNVSSRSVPIIGRASATRIRPIAAMRRTFGRPASRSRSVFLPEVCAVEDTANLASLPRAR